MTTKPSDTTPAVTPRPEHEQTTHSLAWPEILAITALVAFVALLASGALNLMLPWNGV